MTPSRSLAAWQAARGTGPWPRGGGRPTDITGTRRRRLRNRAWRRWRCGRQAGWFGGWRLVCWCPDRSRPSGGTGRRDLPRPGLRRRLWRDARRRGSLRSGGTIGPADGRVRRGGIDRCRSLAVGSSGGSWRFRGSLLRGLLGRRRLARQLLLESSFDRRLHRGRRRADELSHVLQHAEDGLAFDSELLGELVDTDLWHCSPCLRSGSRSPDQLVVVHAH